MRKRVKEIFINLASSISFSVFLLAKINCATYTCLCWVWWAAQKLACNNNTDHAERRKSNICRGRNSSVGSAWARCPQRRGFDPPLGTFSAEGIFPLELTWVQTPFPKTPSDESINRGLVCANMHFIARTQKIPACPRRVNAGNKNTPSTHHPRRRNVTTLMVGLKNGHISKNLTQSGEPQRYSWGTQKKKKKKKKKIFTIHSLHHQLSPTRMLKWPGHNHVQITCNSSDAHHVQHVVYHHMVQRDSSAISFGRV